LTFLFIGHDLSMVRHLSDRVAVMYLGRIVELAATRDIFERPPHPYTHPLISAIPAAATRSERAAGRIVLGGAPSDPSNPPSGCRFYPRCAHATEVCRLTAPVIEDICAGGTSPHFVSCHHKGELQDLT